jgi:hypothetical protein
VCAAAQGLYAELCRQYNKFPDPAGFECANGFLMMAMGNCDEKSIVKWRSQLETAGMINFISRGKEKKPGIYQMLNPQSAAGTTGNIPVAESDKEVPTTGNTPLVEPHTTGIFPVDVAPTTGNFPVDNMLTTGNIPVVEIKADYATTGNIPVALPENFQPTLNKSKVVDTYVSTLSLKKKGEENLEESPAEPVFQMPAIPTTADPFETAAVPPASPLIAAVPPQPKKAKAPRQVFSKPTPEQLEAYFQSRRPEWTPATCKTEAETFHDHYASNGWKVGTAKTPMVDWQASVRNWLKREFSNARTRTNQPGQSAGSSNSKPAASTARKRGGSIDDLQALKRSRYSNPEERTEFTEATVVE